MDNKQILADVLPTEGPYLLAVPARFTDDDGKVVNFFKHFVHHSVDSLFSAGRDAAASGLDAYFALGRIKWERKKRVRKADNIDALGAFWLDLDVALGDPKKYPNKREAALHLREFARAMGLPKPSIVDSGGGLHVYWAVDEDVEVDQWVHYARILKAAATQWGLKQDPSRTADCASVLRVPGTLNFKWADGVEVHAVVHGKVTPKKQLLAALAATGYTAPAPVAGKVDTTLPEGMGTLPAHLQGGAKELNKDVAGGLSVLRTLANPKRVVTKCKQLLWQAQHPEQVSEPQWYDMVGCLRHAKEGDKAVHQMSRGYSAYSEIETSKKIAQHEEQGIGPTLCSTFEDHNPGGCDGCPFLGKVSTPLHVGQELLKAPTPEAEATELTPAIKLPDPPFPFKRVVSADGKTARIAVMILGDDTEHEDVIYEYDIYPQAIIFDEREGKYVVEIRRWLPKDGWELFRVPMGKLYDRRQLSTTFGDIGVMPDLGKVEALVQYMIGYIRELQKHAQSQVVYAQLGWREDSRFVLGDRVMDKGQRIQLTPHENIVNALNWEPPRGSLDVWKTVMDMYQKPGMEAFQFGIGVGFAAPLFKYTNYNGMIVSMVGEKGCGKSSVMHVVNSIWGHKTHSWVDIAHDTMRAFYNKLGVLKNLPACYDEVTNLEEQDLSDLCYAISKGQGRQRLKQDGSARENFGNWQTMLLTTSNASLHARLSMAKADASAEAVRVFEYYVPNNRIKKAEADEKLDLLNDNFGLAGEVFIAAVQKDLALVRERIQYWTRYMEAEAGVTSGERFWAAGPACILTAYEVANDIGLTRVDVGRLAEWSVKATKQMRGTVEENLKTPVSVVGDYLNGNLDKMLVIGSQPQDGKVAYVLNEPRNQLRIRYEQWNGKVYIDRSAFRKYCIERQIDFSRVKAELIHSRVMLDESRIVLGRDTHWRTTQVWCLVLDMTHKDVGLTSTGLNASVASQVASQAVEDARN